MKKNSPLLFLIFLSQVLFCQLNIPAHFTYVEGGEFKEFSEDSSHVFTQKIEAFYMYRFEVSGLDYKRFLKATNKEIPKDLDLKRPITNITYSEAQAYCSWLTSIYKVNFRLPTKEEWQYAARAGNFENEDFIYNRKLPNDYVIYSDNSKNNKPSCISCMQPNKFGLYGMVGNVWEWTEQQLKGFDTTIVGGSYLEDANHVKVTTQKEMNMNNKQKDLGFRFIVSKEDFKTIRKKQ